MNQIILCGTINRKITYTNYANGRQEAKSEIAVNRLDNTGVDYIPFKVCFTNVYDSLKYINKGDTVGIRGSLRFEKNKLFVYATKILLLGSNEVQNEN